MSSQDAQLYLTDSDLNFHWESLGFCSNEFYLNSPFTNVISALVENLHPPQPDFAKSLRPSTTITIPNSHMRLDAIFYPSQATL